MDRWRRDCWLGGSWPQHWSLSPAEGTLRPLRRQPLRHLRRLLRLPLQVDAPTLQACREYENELSASGLGKFKELILANTGGANPQELSAAERAYTPIQARAAVPRVASSIDAFNGVIAVDVKYGRPPTVAALNAVFASVQQECTVAGYSFS